jgi:hypothetical protein
LGCFLIELLPLGALDHYSSLVAYTDAIQGRILGIDDVLNRKRVCALDGRAVSCDLLVSTAVVRLHVHVVGGTRVGSGDQALVTLVELSAVVRIGEVALSGALKFL